MTIGDEYYYQPYIQELCIHKHINCECFCEELFLVKCKSKHSCECTICFFLLRTVLNLIAIYMYFNISGTPSILNGSLQIISVNILKRKKLMYFSNFSLAEPLPSYEYVRVSRFILCNCEIEPGLTYVIWSIGSCSNSPDQAPMNSAINMAFFPLFHMNGMQTLWKNYLPFTHYQKPNS